VITTIQQYIEVLQKLQEFKGEDHPILVFDRLLTDDEAKRLASCDFDAVHHAIDDAIVEDLD
jgi:hypothetical protein